MSADEDYPRQIKACRICGTVLVLVFGTSILGMILKIRLYTTVFESMVEGGSSSLPPITGLLIQYRIPLMALIVLVMMSTLWGLWLARRLSTFIYLAGAVATFFALLAALIELGMHQPLLTIITKFQG
jgi:hypothetical protein